VNLQNAPCNNKDNNVLLEMSEVEELIFH